MIVLLVTFLLVHTNLTILHTFGTKSWTYLFRCTLLTRFTGRTHCQLYHSHPFLYYPFVYFVASSSLQTKAIMYKCPVVTISKLSTVDPGFPTGICKSFLGLTRVNTRITIQKISYKFGKKIRL